jgi:hypothetical protein
MPLMFGIDLALWGVILAGGGIAATFLVYLREGSARIKVSGEFDKTGFVELFIAKRGRSETQIDAIELVRGGSNTALPLISRSNTGPIEFAGGKANVWVYFKLVNGADKADNIEALVGHGKKRARVKIVWTTRNISPQPGTTMIDVRDPVHRTTGRPAEGSDKTPGTTPKSQPKEEDPEDLSTGTRAPHPTTHPESGPDSPR